MTRTTQMIEAGKCIDNKFQPRSRTAKSVAGLAGNIKANGQLTPIVVVADGEGAYQIVHGHRRVKAMKSLGMKWVEAYVEDSWEDAVMACKLVAENTHREDPTAGETGEAIQTMLQLGLPVTQVAASCGVDVTKVRDFARGAQLAPEADPAASFDALVKIGEHRDALTAEDVDAIMAASYEWEMDGICCRAEARAAKAGLEAELARQGVRVVEPGEIDGSATAFHDGEGERAGLLAYVTCSYAGEPTAHFYRELTPEEIEAREQEKAAAEAGPGPAGPTPAEIEAEERYLARVAALEDLDAHVTEFARRIYGKFPSGSGHSKLRKWAHEAFAGRYGEPDGAWRGVKRPKGGAVDRFVLMRTVPGCLPRISRWTLRDGCELDNYDAERVEAFLYFHTEVLAFARYRPTEEEKELFAHLRSLLEGRPAEPEPEAAGIIDLAERIVAEAGAAEPEPAMAA